MTTSRSGDTAAQHARAVRWLRAILPAISVVAMPLGTSDPDLERRLGHLLARLDRTSPYEAPTPSNLAAVRDAATFAEGLVLRRFPDLAGDTLDTLPTSQSGEAESPPTARALGAELLRDLRLLRSTLQDDDDVSSTATPMEPGGGFLTPGGSMPGDSVSELPL